MKKSFYSMMLTLLAFVLVSFVTSCEGPAGKDGATGPAGKDGTNGKDGKDGTISACASCHGKDAVEDKFAEYDLSQHNKGIVYEEEAGRLACGACHTGDGFRESVTLNADEPKVHATSKIDCKTCHTIHTKYDSTDFALSYKDPVSLRVIPMGGTARVTNDFKGAGNLCARCHQGRAFVMPAGDTTFKTTGTTTYTRFGPHYGTPANVFSMKGPIEVTGTTSVPQSNPHATLANGCVSCHLSDYSANPAVGGHTFRMPLVTASGKLNASNFKEVAACKTCHTDATFFTNALSKANEVKTMLAETRTLLISKGLLDTSSTVGATGAGVILGEYIAQSKTGVTYTKAQLAVAINYLYFNKDRSFGVHNPGYVYALVKNGLETLKK